MAPRKKRIAKSTARTARTRSGIKYQALEKDSRKGSTKKTSDMKKVPIIKPLEPIVTRSHKKFGKYRFFAENELSTQSTRISEESSDIPANVESETPSIEQVLLPEPDIGMENENESAEIGISDKSDDETSIIDLVNENSVGEESVSVQSETNTEDLDIPEMECTVTQDTEQDISQQMSNLNVDSEGNSQPGEHCGEVVENIQYITESEKGDMEIYHVDNFESEIIIDCFAEEVIPICGEQEIINENDDSDGVKEMNCDAIELKQNTEDLTAILEGSKSENEELIKESEVKTAEIVSILEGDDNKEIELLESIVKQDNNDTKHKEDNEAICEDNFESVKEPSDYNQAESEVSEMKKERLKLKPKTKVSKKKIEKSEKIGENCNKLSQNSVRRSSRIKSISVQKQKCSKGHGLVKQKSELSMKSIESENGDSNNSTTDSQNNQSNQKNSHSGQITNIPDHKPVKVKSRWRRSSELELNNTVSQSLSKSPLPNVSTSQCDTSLTEITEEAAAERDKEEVAKRLKQFIHLKENLYLTERISCKEARKMVCDCFLTDDDIQQGEYGCGEDCLNRLLMIECGALCAVGDRCTNKRFQKGHFAPCEVFRTEKKGLGIRAAANIPYGEFILEYVGEVLDPEEFEKRAAEYSKDKNQHYYFMSLRADAVIDATRKGNVSRFINHSCDPNAETQKWTVSGELRIGFFSKRTILAGEEITFDYQFQRYGKEAQKCFCEASTCRGWLGEEPDDDEDEDEDDDDEDEEEEEEDEEEGSRKLDIQEAVKDASQVISPSESTEIREKFESQKIVMAKPEKPIKKEKKRTLRQRLPRKELFEDLDLDDEIETLQTTGLKNQAHTLKLSRLMVRAKEPAQRTKLLRVLRRGEFPCRRLFLDYHGLRLIHGWMTDAQHLCRVNSKFESLRLEILQTLATLPIPNKTMLQDSKVLPTVEKWSIKLEHEISPIDSDSNSPKIDSGNATPTGSNPHPVKLEHAPKNELLESVAEKKIEQTSANDGYQEDMDISPVAFDGKETNLNVKNVAPSTLSADHYETEIIALALKLLEEWSVLKEVFRIPKKERIEQMKEHEREADRKYKAGLGLDGQDPFIEKKDLSRYSLLSRRQRKKKRKNSRSDTRSEKDSYIDKYERRKLFAMQVEQREMERRRSQREFWRQHEQRCVVMGADPRFTAPFEPNQEYQCVWNPQMGQWQNYPLPMNQNYNPNVSAHLQHHQQPQQQPQYTTMGHMASNQPPMVPPPMLPPMQQSQTMMKHLQPPGSLPPPPHTNLLQKSPIGYNTQPPLPPHPPNSSQHQYGMRAPPPNMNVLLPNMGHMPNAAPGNQLIHQQRGMMTYPPSIPEHMQLPQQRQQTPSYHLSIDSQNPSPSTQNLVHGGVTSLQSGVHNKPPPPLPALPYQDSIKEQEEVRFMGPIPPPAKLPPKWKCAKDKYGRPYYYHIKIRKAQWEPPELPPEENEELSESTSSSETSSVTSDSSTEETDSDDDIDDAKLLLQIKNKFKQMDAKKNAEKAVSESKEVVAMDDEDKAGESTERSLDDRLIEEFCFMKGNSAGQAKRKRVGLVQEILISPRTEEDRLQFKEDMKRYKQNKEKLKRQKELLLEQSKKHNVVPTVKPTKSAVPSKPPKTSKKHKISVKTKLKEMADNETAKKIKETFRSSMAVVMVSILNTYRKPDCKEGRITNTEDFKHLARKLTHFVMLKELKHCQNIEDLTCTESVKSKAREFVRKYMSKFGEVYQKPKDEVEFY